MPLHYTRVLYIIAFLCLIFPWKTSPVQAGAFTNCASISEIPAAECNALLALYNSTNGPGWTNKTNWFITDTPSNWRGLYLNNGNVTEIYLNFNGLSGSIPPEISNLTKLQWLQLGFNDLTGSIPPQLGSLANLENLYLSHNRLTGNIPAEIGSMPKLNALNVFVNPLKGYLPLALTNLTQLTEFNDYGTYLCDPGDPSFQLWKSNVAAFSSNGQCYSIQGRVSEAGAPLPGVAISAGSEYNTLTGVDGSYQILDVIPGPYTLTATLAGKSFSPDNFSINILDANVTGLNFRTFGPFASCSQQTEIPESECQVLVNFYNSSSGNSWSNHTNWLQTDSPSNWSGVTVMDGHVTTLDLGGRHIQGTIPPQFGSLTYLTGLSLYENQLSGTIPAELVNLSNLQWLSLSYNQLNGKIPPQLSSLTNLQNLSLSHNRFTGSIPVSFTALSHLKVFDTSSTLLCEPQDAGFQTWKATITSFYSPGLCYSISGQATDAGSPLAGVIIADANSNSIITGSDGAYILLDLPSSTYNLTATLSGKTFSPPTHTLTISGANVSGANFRTFGPYIGCSQQTEIPAIECNALVALYNATNGASWSNRLNWLETDSPSNWSGVSVLGGHVVRLELSNRSLNGNIPVEISSLSHLVNLNLSNNQLKGTIPSEISSLVGLQSLSLEYNLLTGRIPVSFTGLTQMQQFGASTDYVCIPNDPALIDWLTRYPRWAVIRGEAWYQPPWCYSISGLITESTGGPASGVTLSYYHASAVSGPDGSYTISDVPASMYDEVLRPAAPGRSFSPQSISLKGTGVDLTGMNFIASGAFKGCDQQAEIPAIECSALVALYSQTNGTYWEHRDHWLETDTPGNWEGVTVAQGHVVRLYAYGFHMVGSLPEELGNLTELTSLELTWNDLRGNLPASLMNLAKLTGLDLADNSLTGSFPAGIDQFTNLAYLDLSSNLFNGSLPLSLSNLSQLKNFNVRSTHLCEPRDAGFQAWKTSKYNEYSFQSPGLCYSASGKVSQAGGPLAGVTVSNGYFRTTETASDGTYTLTEMPPGYYTITPSLTPYIFTPPSLGFYVGDGADSTGKDFFAGQTTYSISGRVLLNGSPLYNVALTTQFGTSTINQSDGTYTFSGLVPGSYTLTPSLYGYTFSPAALTVTVSNSSVTGQNFNAIQQIHSISGRVYCGGSPVYGVYVYADPNHSTYVYSSDGAYSISGLFPGTYTLTTSIYRCTPSPMTRTVVMADTDVTGIDFDGTWLTNSISGRVLLDGSPLAGVTVSTQNGSSAVTDQNGAYVLNGLRSNNYYLTATLQGYVFKPTTKYAQVSETDVTGQDFQAFHPFSNCASQTEIPTSECEALAALYNSTNGSSWGRPNDGFWLVNDMPSTWVGITVTAGHVTKVDLRYRNMTGTLPAELGNLPYLQELDLGNNNLTGNIPPEFSGLTNLTNLNLSVTRLSGKIPLSLTALSKLAFFYTSGTYLCEPQEAAYQAWKATISTVYSQGLCYSIRGRITEAGSPLAGVSVSDGTIHTTITAADGTYLLENLPHALNNLYPSTYTVTPALSGKQFSPARRTFQTLDADLTNIDFRVSMPFVSCDLQTEIPAIECSALAALYNSTGGGAWSSRTNWLVTDTPANWYGITVSEGHVTGIDLHSNRLAGLIPALVGNLAQLTSLNLGYNQLSGRVPVELGNLTQLSSLDISYNASLYGSIPLSFTSLTQLQQFQSFSTGLCSPQDAGFQAWKTALGGRWYPSPNPSCYSLSGKITKSDGSPVAGVVIAAASSIQATSGSDGGYIFPDLPAGGHTLMPALSGLSFSPVSLSVSITNANLTGINFLASSPFTGCANQVEIPEPECAALAAIYNQAGGTGWTNRTHWLETDLPGNWYGVTLLSGHVNSLSLDNNRLVGTLPPEIGQLTFLQNLDLGMNTLLQGSLPGEIGQMASLKTIDLFATALSGSIPRSMMSLTHITCVQMRATYLCEPADLAFQTWKAAAGYWETVGLCYAIRGSITQGGTPLAGVTISNGRGRSAVSGMDGAYAITEVPPNSYTLTPSLANTAFSPSSLSVSLSNSDLSGKNFTAVPTIFSVSGQVLIGSSPLAGVTIADNQGHTAISGADGIYTLGGLPAGSYTLTPAKTGYSFTPNSLSITLSVSSLSGKNFSAALITYSISGQVIAGSSPLAGVTISDGQGHTTLTGSDGRYTLSGLLPGSYTLTPSRAGYSFSPSSMSVALTNANLTGKNFTGSLNTYSISGQILLGGSPLANVTITDGQGHTVLSGADGRYTFTGLVPGNYTLAPVLQGYAFTPLSWPVTLSSANLSSVNFSGYIATYSISGRVYHLGRPVGGATIADGQGHSTLSAGDGRYTLPGLTPGRYTLSVTLPGQNAASASIQVNVSDANVINQEIRTGFQTFLPALQR